MATKAGHQLNIILAFPGFCVLPIDIDAVQLVLVDQAPSACGEASTTAFVRTCTRKGGLVSLCSTDRQDQFEMTVAGLQLCECPETSLSAIDGDVAVNFVVFKLCLISKVGFS